MLNDPDRLLLTLWTALFHQHRIVQSLCNASAAPLRILDVYFEHELLISSCVVAVLVRREGLQELAAICFPKLVRRSHSGCVSREDQAAWWRYQALYCHPWAGSLWVTKWATRRLLLQPALVSLVPLALLPLKPRV